MIIKKSAAEIEKMRVAGRVVAAAFDAVREQMRPGVKTKQLDAVVERTIREAGCVPSFKGYKGFPGSACVSLNEEIVHGIPGRRKLKEGDLVKLDVGAIFEGYHADSAWTFYVGEQPPPEVEKLMRATEESLWAGIGQAKPGNRVGDVSHAVQQVAEGAGFSVVREYVGHAVGTQLHEEGLPIPNFGPPARGPKLSVGMTFALEPMVNIGGWETAVLDDGWTVVTADGSLSAHYEHSIAVTEDGPVVLTTSEGS